MDAPWALTPRPHPDLPLPPSWRWLLPGVGGALAWLRAHALGPGRRLGLGPGQTPATLALLQAAALRGVTVVLLQARLGEEERARQRHAARAATWAADPTHPLASEPGVLPLPVAFAEAPVAPRDLLPADAWAQAALVLFTSGTTGAAKPARLPLASLSAAARAGCARLALDERATWLACLGLDHIGGASLAYRAAVAGVRLRLLPRFDPAAVAAALPGCDGVSLVPTMLQRLLPALGGAGWPASVRAALIGGGPLPEALAAASAAAGCEPLATYGLTEAGSQVCTPPPTGPRRGWVGPPLDGVEVAIRAPDGAALPPGVVGSVWLRGPILFAGYETGARLEGGPGADGWFATGDLGERDARGWLRIHCRREDLILSGGENIYPAAVEAALERHPGVREAGVCPLPDPEWGQVVAAVVVLDDPQVSWAALAATVARTLGPRHQPRRWAARAALPRTAGGKLQRHLLPACFTAPVPG